MDVDRLRAQTPGCLHRIHLNNAGAALMSRSTLAEMTTHLQLEAETEVEAWYLGLCKNDPVLPWVARWLTGSREAASTT